MTDDPLDEASPGGDAGGVTPERRGSHRAQQSPTSVVIPLLVVAVAVLAIGVGIFGWVTAFDPEESAAAVQPIVTTPTAPPPSVTPSPTPEPSTSPSATPEPTKSTKPSPSKSDKPKPKPSKTATDPVARTTPVVVLNQTSISGLAATTATRLRADGWTVTGVGNWRGSVPATTVYYPAGSYAQATLLSRDVGAQRVRPAVSGMRVDRLTVILTSAPG